MKLFQSGRWNVVKQKFEMVEGPLFIGAGAVAGEKKRTGSATLDYNVQYTGTGT